jgi:uncharacterized protein YndB with AHSA1/START domain
MNRREEPPASEPLASSSLDAAANAAARGSERELHFTRLFDAPRAVVFRAWTDPEQVIHWYGPKGFTVEHIEMNVRPGGAWRKCMRSPAGVDYWRSGVYLEVVEPERLSFTYVSDDPQGIKGHETLVTIDFLDRGGQTLMIFKQGIFESVATRNSHRGGWGESMDRFAAWVESRAA